MSLPKHKNILLLITRDDDQFLHKFKQFSGDCAIFVSNMKVDTFTEIELYCKQRNITGILSTSLPLLKKLIGYTESNPSIDNYAGSLFKKSGLEIVFVHPLAHLYTVPYGEFLMRRYTSKLIDSQAWEKTSCTEFKWKLVKPENVEEVYERLQASPLIAVDIETKKQYLTISCIGFTAIFFDSPTGKPYSESYVLPITNEFELEWMKKLVSVSGDKIFQNGKYDNSYLTRWNAPVYNWLWDTANMFHAWYSELPKDLASLGAFFIRDVQYWKDLAETSDLMEYYKYNALDTWVTANVMLAWIEEAPAWAKVNYLKKFPINFPSHLCEMTGIKRDGEKLEIVRTEIKELIKTKTKNFELMTGHPGINTNSPKQMKELLFILGSGDLPSTQEMYLNKCALRHPFNARIISTLLDIRGDRKLISTYLRSDEDKKNESDKGAKEFNGTILYSINPHGTDTGRNASREHHFWCGLQIQNIPRGETVKQTFVSYPGFLFGESDLEQAESRDTAYIAGEEKLIEAVSNARDFHSVNASAFFGIPYEEIYDDKLKKTKNKKLRDLAKRVNHGANYNMGANTLVNTMGEDKIIEARNLLKLPRSWNFRQVAEYLLGIFHRTYPGLAGIYYTGVTNTIKITKLLVGATGWTRYCFGNPTADKLALNAYIAHGPQSLNAMVLDEAFMEVFYKLAMDETHRHNFKLLAQVHDSILFQYKEGHDYLAEKVKELMEIPVEVKGYDGKTRTFTVPAALKSGKRYWSELE